MSIPAEYGPVIVGAAYLVLGIVSNWINERKFKRDMKRLEREGLVR